MGKYVLCDKFLPQIHMLMCQFPLFQDVNTLGDKVVKEATELKRDKKDGP